MSAQPDGPAAVKPVNQFEQDANPTAFQQFVAQSILASAEPGTDVHRQAASEVAKLRGYSAPSRDAFGAQAQLRKDEWKTLDENLVNVAQENLVIVDDLRGSGLTLNSDLSTLIHEYQGTGVFGDATVDMSPASGADEDASAFSMHGVPLPIVQKGFNLDVRTQLMPSRSVGQSLDTTNQSKAARSVFEGLEDLVFNGWTSTVEGYQVYGLRGANAEPNINTFAGADWDDYAGVTAETVRGDILTAIETLENDNYGPGNTGYWWYGGRAAYQSLRRRDTGTDQERGLFERLREEFDEITRWRRADALPDDEFVMFKPTEEVLQLAVASDVQNVEWENYGGWEITMKVMASMTPIVKSDDAGQSGIVNATGLLSP